MHWALAANPLFDPYRTAAPSNPVFGLSIGANDFAFDLPDTGFLFPGDRLHYYLTASDDLAGDVRTSVWPPDTTSAIAGNSISGCSMKTERTCPSR